MKKYKELELLLEREIKRKKFQDVLNISSILITIYMLYNIFVSAISKDYIFMVISLLIFLFHYVLIYFIQSLTDNYIFKPYVVFFEDNFLQIYSMNSFNTDKIPVSKEIKKADLNNVVPVDKHVLDLYRKSYNGSVPENYEFILKFIGIKSSLKDEFKNYKNNNAKEIHFYTIS